MSDYADKIAADVMPALSDVAHVNHLYGGELEEIYAALAEAARRGYALGYAAASR